MDDEEAASGGAETVAVGDDDKKRRGSGGGKRGGGGAAPPSCQAEMCAADLTEAKRYHRRHKVCEFHAKASVVLVAGIRQRFCQQCSRFHELSEFDEAKRSCRRRLAGHNERRRKSSSSEPHGEAASSSSRKIGSPLSSSRSSDNPSQHQMKETQFRPTTDERGRVQTTLPPANSAAYKHFQIR